MGTHLLVLILGFLVWIVPLEWAARAWTERYGDPLDKTMRILRMDARLGWRQRELYRGHFLGIPLETDALGLRNPKGTSEGRPAVRIVVLGPSSTFGWGVWEDATYSRQLEGLIGRHRPRLKPWVVNAGQIGFSTWQGLEFYKSEIFPLKPDILIVAYGVNDVDRHRFFFNSVRPDSEALGQEASRWRVALQNAFGRLQMVHVVRRSSLILLDRLACRGGGAGGAGPPGVRVGLDGFLASFDAFLQTARRQESKVVVLTSGFLLPESGPQRRTGAADCEAGYALAASLRGLGRCAEARKALEAARKLEPLRIARDLREYNAGLRSLARKRGVPLVDVERLLGGTDASSLFVDPIHPSPEGHRRIAEAILRAIRIHGLLEVSYAGTGRNGKRV